MFSASFFLQTRSANVVWVPSLFLASFIQFPLFFCLFSIFSNDNVFAIRCKWQISKSCLFFFFWAQIFSTFLVTFGLRPFLYPFSLGPNSIVGEKDVQSELSPSLVLLTDQYLFFAVSLSFFSIFYPLRAWSQSRDLYIFIKNRLEVHLQGRLLL